MVQRIDHRSQAHVIENRIRNGLTHHETEKEGVPHKTMWHTLFVREKIMKVLAFGPDTLNWPR